MNESVEILHRRLTAAASLPPEDFWRDRAACASTMVDMFPDNGSGQGNEAARAVCLRCPVIARCLAVTMAVEKSEPAKTRHGVAGGATAVERWELHRYLTGVQPKPRISGGKQPAPCGTQAAWERHRRNKERVCPDCAAWRRAQDEWRSSCGTPQGYDYHRLVRYERPCADCQAAHDKATN